MQKIQLGSEVRCIITNFKGILLSEEFHYYGCTTYTIQPMGTDDISKQRTVSSAYVEKIGEGVINKVQYSPEIVPRFNLGDKIETVMGLQGTITIIQRTLHGSLRYFAEPGKEASSKSKEVFITFEPLMRKVE